MTSVNGVPVLHLAGVLGLLMSRLRADISELAEPSFAELRASHFRLLELIPPEGARITDLAEVAGMTKQGLGQHVNYLERNGYVSSERLPVDKRVRLVRRTSRGDEGVAMVQAVIAQVEKRWQTELGPQRYAEFLATARELGITPARATETA
ncbi:MarR family winged helix-turn-helix transcriptional regulator [Kribbella deserti]|uniref:MarR family winged helix-turn-helix transcriptional regulator n=1 Tax=Kribbella deserti TaxID=1926257 RepID=A0ABV6QMS5_9ACTN